MMMGSWMGSDFTNDDLVREVSLVEEYTSSLKAHAGAYTLTLIPKGQVATVWGKIIYRIGSNYIPKEVDYYSEKGEKVRTMRFSDPKKMGDRTLPSRLTMVPHKKKGYETQVIYEDLIFDEPLKNSVFSLKNLKKR